MNGEQDPDVGMSGCERGAIERKEGLSKALISIVSVATGVCATALYWILYTSQVAVFPKVYALKGQPSFKLVSTQDRTLLMMTVANSSKRGWQGFEDVFMIDRNTVELRLYMFLSFNYKSFQSNDLTIDVSRYVQGKYRVRYVRILTENGYERIPVQDLTSLK